MYHRSLLVGKWHRGGKDGEHSYSELAEMSIDGRFLFTFYTFHLDGHLSEQVSEIGSWGLVGDIHFTITEEEVVDGKHYAADMEDEENYHAYKIIELSEEVFKYQHLVSGEVFTLFRVKQAVQQN
ncbi:hypothetical protein [Thalassotalea aquiviva]|uniref:hypothetical protein n=1 Tax=Thalassotalea aquiviva TaxID=3242415 RepID=UPI003529FF70